MNHATRIAATLGLGALAAVATFAAPANNSKSPNIIFILTDDLGYGDVGVFWQNQRRDANNPYKPWHSTPNLDRMAAEGARFTSQYVAAPVCVASRSSLMQGVHQGHATVRNNQFDKALEENHTLGTVLQQGGYATAAIGKWGLQGAGKGPDWPSHPLKRGFDYYYGYMRHIDGHEHYPIEMLYFKEKAKQRGPLIVWENRTDATAGLDKCYTTDLFTARAKKWIVEQRQQSPSKPFFLYLAYDTPHAVLELPTQPYPAGGGLKGGIQWLGTPGHAITTASGVPDSWVHNDYSDKPWPDVNKRHASAVRRIDDAVGDLLQLLKDLAIDDNTLVIFTSDNGPAAESYLPQDYHPSFFASYGPYDGIKRDCWEGGMRVPTITRWPTHIPADRVISAPTAFWDWLPTFANLAGKPAPARSDGTSLLPLLSNTGTFATDRALYFEYGVKGKTPDYPDFESSRRGRMRGEMQAIRLGDMMGVRYNIKSPADDFEIYNVVTDPKENTNLASARQDLQIEMKMRALQMRIPSTPAPRPYDNELVPAITTKTASNGTAWAFYKGVFPWVPDTTNLTPEATGHASEISIAMLKPAENGAVCFTGCMEIPSDGEYTFHLFANTGAVLRIHEATVIDADYGYRGDEERSGTIKLKAGLHPVKLTYNYQGNRNQPPKLSLFWSSATIPKQALPPGILKTLVK